MDWMHLLLTTLALPRYGSVLPRKFLFWLE
jgi:hypothetical protein